MKDITVAILAVQGAFIEHEQMLDKLGVNYIELRKEEDVYKKYDALILPGGESTVQGKLLRELNMRDELVKRISEGLPVLGTCAGMILLCSEISGGEHAHIGLLPAKVKRNAYGRQLGSFYTEGYFKGLGSIPMTFIRAPYIDKVYDDTKVLASVKDNIVAIENKNILAVSFHPELDNNTKLHKYFLEKAVSK